MNIWIIKTDFINSSYNEQHDLQHNQKDQHIKTSCYFEKEKYDVN